MVGFVFRRITSHGKLILSYAIPRKVSALAGIFLSIIILNSKPSFSETTDRIGIPLAQDGVTPWGELIRQDFIIIDASVAVLPINLETQITGTLPSENTVSTTVYTSKQNVFTDTNNFQKVSASSASINGPLNVTGLTSGQCVQVADATGLLTTSGASCAGAAGGASKLGVNQNGTQVTSPTFALNGLSPPFLITSVGGGATAQWALDGSSVTLRGNNVIYLQNGLQSGATFFVSSGSVAGQFTANRIAVSTLAVSGDAVADNLRITGSGIKVDALTAGQCVQTGTGGLLSTTGGPCGGAPGGSTTQVQFNNGGNFSGTSLETVDNSSITFVGISTTNWANVSSMTMTGMLFDGTGSSITFSSATLSKLYFSSATSRSSLSNGNLLSLNTTGIGATINSNINSILTGDGTALSQGSGLVGSAVGSASNFGVQGNASGGLTNYSGYFNATGTGGGNTNYGGYFNASGAGTNHGIYLNAGDMVLGGSTGSLGNIFTSAGANTTPTWNSTLSLASFNTTTTSTTVYGTLEIGDSATGFSGNSRLSYNPLSASPELKLFANNNTATTNDIDFINSSGITYAQFRANPTGGGIVSTKQGGLSSSFGISAATMTVTDYFQLASKTKAQLAVYTPTAVGQKFYCSDCSALRECISTGTAQGAFSSPVAATTGCN